MSYSDYSLLHSELARCQRKTGHYQVPKDCKFMSESAEEHRCISSGEEGHSKSRNYECIQESGLVELGFMLQFLYCRAWVSFDQNQESERKACLLLIFFPLKICKCHSDCSLTWLALSDWVSGGRGEWHSLGRNASRNTVWLKEARNWR